MKRRTLDFLFSGGGLVVALLLLAVGLLLSNQASFAEDYVKDQLQAQRITFADADSLSDEDTSWKPGSECLEEHAGKLMETGKQAECYANYFIALHMDGAATRAGYPDETYATMGGIRSGINAELASAKEDGDEALTEELQMELDTATSLRSTFQTGETLRGLLLTTYGFSIFGERAELIGIICFVLAGILAALAAAGLVHAFMTPADETVYKSD